MESPLENFEKALVRQLDQPILLVVGPNWFRGDEKQGQKKLDTVYVKEQVVSFEGPNNHLYTEEIITFKIAGQKVKPIYYYNRVIPENEWYRFKFLVN